MYTATAKHTEMARRFLWHFVRELLLLLGAASLAAAQVPSPRQVWKMQDSGTTAGLRGIDSVDGKVAWSSGTGGTVLRTTDGGAHWTRCATPDADKDGAALDFRGIQARDAQRAMIMASGPGDKSRLYKTTDGCKSWTRLFTNPDAPKGFFDCLSLMHEQRTLGDNEGFGLLLGDSVGDEMSVFETRDGGRSWIRLHDPLLRTGASAFAASNECISQMNASVDLLINGTSGSANLRGIIHGYYWLNNGSPVEWNWNRVTLPLAAGTQSAGAYAVNGRVWIKYGKSKKEVRALKFFKIAVGGDYARPNDSAGTAAYSADGGEHWTASATPPHGYRSAVQWSQSLHAWITVGTSGSDISRDDGRTWQPLDNGNWNALSLPFVVGPDGRIARLDPQLTPPATN